MLLHLEPLDALLGGLLLLLGWCCPRITAHVVVATLTAFGAALAGGPI